MFWMLALRVGVRHVSCCFIFGFVCILLSYCLFNWVCVGRYLAHVFSTSDSKFVLRAFWFFFLAIRVARYRLCNHGFGISTFNSCFIGLACRICKWMR